MNQLRSKKSQRKNQRKINAQLDLLSPLLKMVEKLAACHSAITQVTVTLSSAKAVSTLMAAGSFLAKKTS